MYNMHVSDKMSYLRIILCQLSSTWFSFHFFFFFLICIQAYQGVILRYPPKKGGRVWYPLVDNLQYQVTFFLHLTVLSSYCVVPTSHVTVLFSYLVVPLLFSHIWWFPYFFLIFYGFILTLCSSNITFDSSFVTFGGSLIYFSHSMVSFSHCAIPTSYLTVILLHLVVPLFVSQI